MSWRKTESIHGMLVFADHFGFVMKMNSAAVCQLQRQEFCFTHQIKQGGV